MTQQQKNPTQADGKSEKIPKAIPGGFFVIPLLIMAEMLVTCLPVVTAATILAGPVLCIHEIRRFRSGSNKRFHYLRAIAFCTVVILAIGAVAFHYWDYNNTDKNGNALFSALEQYHTKTGEYPQKLKELVPEYIASIPQARSCLACRFTIASTNGFTYIYRRGRKEGKFGPTEFDRDYADATPTFCYVVIPPFGRTCWNFSTKTSYTLD